MKNCSYICGVQARTVLTLLGVGIFISAYIGCRNYGLPIPDGFCTVRSEIVLAEQGIAQPFSCAAYYNFSFMARTMKNCNQGNNSTLQATSTHETSESLYSKFLIEKDAKNKAYAFILSSGLLHDFIEFNRHYNGEANSVRGRVSLIAQNL